MRSETLLILAEWWHCDDGELASQIFDNNEHALQDALNFVAEWRLASDVTPGEGYEHQVYFSLLVREAIGG